MLLSYTERGHPIQETGLYQAQARPVQYLEKSILGRPKLLLTYSGETDNVGKDVPMSPEDLKRERIRIKRLARLSADETGEGPFEEGDMVHVESLGYGVVKWLGFLKLKRDSLIAGVEFVRLLYYFK